MVNYQNAKVYKLVLKGGADEAGDCYVGSTTLTLSQRMTDHKRAMKKGRASKVYQWMRDVGIDNVDIILLESTPCTSFEEQRMHEQRWKEQLQPSLNTISAYISREERLHKGQQYYVDNRDALLLACFDYRSEHREEINARSLRYRRDNREKINARMRDYYAKTRESRSAYNRQYHARNKTALMDRQKERYALSKDKALAYAEKYRTENREEIRRKCREYSQREEIRARRQVYQKRFRQENRELVNQRNREYYRKNREKILAAQAAKRKAESV